MSEPQPGRLLSIYVSAEDQWHGAPLYTAIVQEARKQGLAGATVLRGIMGYGAQGVIHEPHALHPTGGLPVLIEIVDSEERIKAFMPTLGAMIAKGLVTITETEVLIHRRSER